MPMTYEIDTDAGLVRIFGSGTLSDDEMVDCITALRADADLRPDMNALSDMRAIEVGFTSEGIARMLQVLEASDDRRASGRAAVVVSSDVAFGMGRMMELSAEGHTEPRFRIFRDLGEARSWLGIE